MSDSELGFDIIPDIKVRFSHTGECLECSICQLDLSPPLDMCTVCENCFHRSCMQKWLECKAICPLCRGNIALTRNKLAEVLLRGILDGYTATCTACKLQLKEPLLRDHQAVCKFFQEQKYEKKCKTAILVKKMIDSPLSENCIEIKSPVPPKTKVFKLSIPYKNKSGPGIVMCDFFVSPHKKLKSVFLLQIRLCEVEGSNLELPINFSVIAKSKQSFNDNFIEITEYNKLFPVMTARLPFSTMKFWFLVF